MMDFGHHLAKNHTTKIVIEPKYSPQPRVQYGPQDEFSLPFEPPVEACTSIFVGILALKATRLGRLLDPGR